MRSSLLFLLLGGAVLAGGFALRQPDADVRSIGNGGVRDIAALLPDTCALKLVIDGGPAVEHGDELALHALASEPEVAAFLAPVETAARGWLARFEQPVKEYLGLTMDETLRLVQYRTTVGLCGVVPPANPDALPRPDAIISLEFGDDLEMVRRLMHALEKAVLAWGNGHFTDDTVAGLPVRRYVPDPKKPNTPPAWYLVEDRMLLLATRKATLEGVIKRMKSGSTEGSLAATTRYQSVKDRVERPRSLFSIYADVGSLTTMVAPLLRMPPGDNPVAAFGLDAIEAVGYGLDMDGKGLRDRIFMKIAEGPLRTALVSDEKTKLHEIVPASTGLYGSFQFEFVKIWNYAREVLGALDPGVLESATEGMQALSDVIGVDVEKELLPRLGPELALAASFPGQAVIPDLALILQVRDRPAVMRMFDTAMRSLDAPISAFDHSGHRMHVLDLGLMTGGELPSIRVTWTFVGDHLVISPDPQGAKNFVDHVVSKGPTLAESDDFRSLLAHLRAEDPETATTAVSYVDLEGMVGFLCDNGAPLAQSLLPPSEATPVDWVLIPHTDTITKHLFGLAGGARWTDDGYYAEYWSPTGYLGPYLVSLGFIGYGWSRQVEMHQAEIEARRLQEKRMRSAVPFEIETDKPVKGEARPTGGDKKGGK